MDITLDTTRSHRWFLTMVFGTLGVGAWLTQSWISWIMPTRGGGCGCAVGRVFSENPLLMGLGGALALVFAGGLIYGLIYMIRSIRSTRKFAAAVAVRALPLPRALEAMTSDLQLPARVIFFASPRSEAYSNGILRPTIAISSDCLNRLSESEIKAVLLHEASHVSRHDPLRFLILETIARVVFYIPFISSMVAHLRTVGEVAADGCIEDRAALGRALISMSCHGKESEGPSFANALGARIKRLMDPSAPLTIVVGIRSIVVSMVVIVSAIIVLGTHPVTAVGAGVCTKIASCNHATRIDTAPSAYYPVIK